MKYDDQIFNLSAEAYNMVETINGNKDEEVLRKQNELLKILLKKFQEQLKSKKDIGDGILKVKFESRFWSDFNDGYREIAELVKSNNFDSFASEYCMYIGDVEHRCDEYYSAYYEVIWDYKTYFEQLKNSELRKKATKELCEVDGHDFGEWEEERIPLPINNPITSKQLEIINWRRMCNRCGHIEVSNEKPVELKKVK